MITCARCDEKIRPSGACSDLSVLVLHWMQHHPIEYGRMHPECTPFMPNHPNYREEAVTT